MAQLVLTETQDCQLSVTARSRKGSLAPLQNPMWETSDAAVLTVVADPGDGTKATVSAQVAGTALITFTADADMGEGVVPIVGTLDVVISAGMATVVEISAGTPVEQP